MTIAPTPVHEDHFESLGAWTKADFGGTDEWAFTLRPETIAELDRAVEALRANGKELSTLTSREGGKSFVSRSERRAP